MSTTYSLKLSFCLEFKKELKLSKLSNIEVTKENDSSKGPAMLSSLTHSKLTVKIVHLVL